MEIRAANVADLPQVLPMVQSICDLHEAWDPARFSFRPDIRRMYESWLGERASDPRSVFLVAEEDARIIGYVICTIESDIPIYRITETGWIHDLWVEENYRNEGVARQLTEMVIARFREMNVRQIRLQTAQANEVARKLFARCGFRPAVVEMLWDQNEHKGNQP